MIIYYYYFAAHTVEAIIEESLKKIAQQGAHRVQDNLDSIYDVLEAIAALEEIKDPAQPWRVKFRVIEAVSRQKKPKILRFSIADTHGNARTSDGRRLYIGDRAYYQKALKGQRSVSDPIVSRVDGSPIITFAVPIYYQGKVSGVIYTTHAVESLSLITDDIRIGKNGSSFLVNKEGKIIAHRNRQLIYTSDGDSHTVKNQPPFSNLTVLEKQMVSGQTGASKYLYHGIFEYVGFAPIHETGWSFAITVPRHEVFYSLDIVLLLLSLLLIFILILFVFVNASNVILQNSLQKEQSFLDNATKTANIVLLEVNPRNGRIKGLNQYAEENFGDARSILQAKTTLYDLVPKSHIAQVQQYIKELNVKQAGSRLDFPLINQNGKEIPFIWSAQISRSTLGVTTISLMGVDITERVHYERRLLESNEKLTALYRNLSASEELLRQQYAELSATQARLVKSEERYQLAQEGSNDVLWDCDLVTNQIYVSPKFYELFGYAQGDLGESPADYFRLCHPDDYSPTLLAIRQFLAEDTAVFHWEFRLRTADHNYLWVDVRGKAVVDANGHKIRAAGSLTDITAKKAQDAIIHKMAYYDSLTGLPNRAALYTQSTAVIARAVANHTMGALLFLDVDNFKLINDSFGHTVGDGVLSSVSIRLQTILPKCDTYRLSGDEFVVLAPKIHSIQEASTLAERVLAAFSKPFEVHEHVYHVTLSIGIAIFPHHGENIEELLKSADTAMYRAKESGKSRYVLFDQSMKAQTLEKLSIESHLRTALDNQEFYLLYQPQVEAQTGFIRGFEALLRWKHPQYAGLSPAKFIPIAEENGLIVPIGQWALEEACRFAARLQDEGLDELKISINVSARQLIQSDFVDRVTRTIKRYQIAPSRIGLELTETALMESFELSADKLRSISERGIEIHLDDFGTGYSSLNYLHRLPISLVKIDKSFVSMIFDRGAQSIVSAIITLSRQFGLQVIAEGVETKEQLNYLLAQNCQTVQGYLFSKPIPEEEALRLAQIGFIPTA